MQKITPFLWYNDNAEEAMNLYISIFKDSKVLNVSRYGEGGPGPAGSVMVCAFQLEGQQFQAINGGPMFKFTEAISLMVNVDTQEELDNLWYKLSEGGSESRCGWLKDKFGLSWQIIPRNLGAMMSNPDKAKAGRVMAAMLKMGKIVIADLERAAEGE